MNEKQTSERKYAPINYLVAALNIAGTDLIVTSGYLTALWHARDLGGFPERDQIESAGKAIARVSAALDAYEAANRTEVA